MEYKVMWCVCISSINTDIHGRIYCKDKDDAIAKLKETIASDLEKVKKQYPYVGWYSDIMASGKYGNITSSRWLTSAGDYERYLIMYRVKKMRTTV